MIKCVECGTTFKEDENVVITHGDLYDPVHEKCHYSYLLNNRLKDTMSLNEYEKQLGKKLSNIRHNVLKEYEGQKLEEIFKQQQLKKIG